MLENSAYFPGHTASTSGTSHGNSRSRGNSPAAIRSTSSNTIRNNSSSGTSTHDSASKLTKKNTKRNTDSRKSPSTSSPDQQGYTSNSGGGGSGSKSRSENNLRERLSPAAQRFVAESSDFTASTSVMRRLPSPVLTRHSSSSRNTNNGSSSYNNNYGNLRSPSADAAVRRSFDVTSMENLAETARNINYHQQLSKPLIVAGEKEKHHHATSNSSGRAERVNSSSTSMILQERLKEAQKAFAAMRETY